MDVMSEICEMTSPSRHHVSQRHYFHKFTASSLAVLARLEKNSKFYCAVMKYKKLSKFKTFPEAVTAYESTNTGAGV